MRNVFDQYSQKENRLTHALVSALNEDKRLCRAFVVWATGNKRIPKKIHVIEQQLVGELALTEEEAEKKGLPDAWFHDDDVWSLLLESKVKASLTKNQLERHYRTASKRGFSKVTVLALTVLPQKDLGLDYVVYRCWSEVFTWLRRQEKYSDWAARTSRYMELVDAAWGADGYLEEGTLTMFTGIPFSDDNPYNYREAKLYLRQAMDELRKRKNLAKMLGADLNAPGRGAITGRSSYSVWDFIPLQQAAAANAFTSYPHLTLYLSHDHMGAIVSVPNSLKRQLRRNIINLGEPGFIDLMSRINKNMANITKRCSTAVPHVALLQRHYTSQRSPAVMDASLEFDLRTAFPSSRKSVVKLQKQWISVSYQVLAHKSSNMHLSVGMNFKYGDGRVTNDPAILDRICDVWIACKPLLDCMLR